MHENPRFIVIQAPSFDGTTVVDPNDFIPQNAATPGTAAPTRNYPRYYVTYDAPVGRLNVSSLLRDGGLGALVQFRSITPPEAGDGVAIRSGAAGEQIGPVGINQALRSIALSQDWSEPVLLDPTDAISFTHDPTAAAGQIEVLVYDLDGEGYLSWLTAKAQSCCEASPSQGRREFSVGSGETEVLAALAHDDTIVRVNSSDATANVQLPAITYADDASRKLKIFNNGPEAVNITTSGATMNGTTQATVALAANSGYEFQPYSATIWHRD